MYRKLSELTNGALPLPGHARVDADARYLLDLSCPRRLMWGSDRSVVELAMTYEQWLGTTVEIAALQHVRAVFGQNVGKGLPNEALVMGVWTTLY
jgi:hypothetical protein